MKHTNIAFLSFLDVEMTQVVEMDPHGKHIQLTVDIMATDDP